MRNDGATVPLTCTIAGGTVQATLAQACYVFEGDLTGVMRLSMPQNGLLTLSVLRFRVRKETTDSFVDPEQIIPSLDELLAKISACEAAATAANTATSSANTAASAATSVTAAANAAASAANTAAAGAQAEAKKFSAIAVEVKTLPPSAEATGSAAQTASKTTFSFGIPASNLAYATFKIDSRNHLIMTSPEGFSNIGFAINRKTGHLEVQINA
ncbi:MAG: hypothetical protein RSB86_18190 [Comamonas sp.]|uniref:hypothetical protein n=1 Tax=Comamonas sp. TaxID=34028 RepID=UPI002FC94C22